MRSELDDDFIAVCEKELKNRFCGSCEGHKSFRKDQGVKKL
jgi:hypothetical protein